MVIMRTAKACACEPVAHKKQGREASQVAMIDNTFQKQTMMMMMLTMMMLTMMMLPMLA